MNLTAQPRTANQTADTTPLPEDPLLIKLLEVAGITTLALVLLTQSLVPAWRVLHTDFPNYYLVARLLREGYALDRIYDWVWLQRIKDHWGLDQSLVGFAGLTPFSALPVLPLTIFSALTAKRIWIILNLLFLTTSTEALHRTTTLGRRRIWLLTLLAVIPLRTSFLYGQMHLAVLLFITLAWCFHRRNRDLACGICIAFAAALKVYPLFFGLYFVWKKQLRATLGVLYGTAAVIAIGCLTMGTRIIHIYASQILPRSLQGEVVDPYNIHLASAAALFHRIFLLEPALNPAPFFYSPTLYAITYPLWQLTVLLPLFALFLPSPIAFTSEESTYEKLEWSAFLFVLLLMSPVPSSYHFVALIFCIVLLTDFLLRRKAYALAATAVSLYILISTIEFSPAPEQFSPAFVTPVAFARFWLELLLFALYLVCLIRYRTQHEKSRSNLRILVLCTGSTVVLIASIAGNLTHLTHIGQDIGRSTRPPADTNLATSPRAILKRPPSFTSMVPDGYRNSRRPISPPSTSLATLRPTTPPTNSPSPPQPTTPSSSN